MLELLILSNTERMLPLFVVTMPPNPMRRQSTAFVTLPTLKRSNSDVHIWLTDFGFFDCGKIHVVR